MYLNSPSHENLPFPLQKKLLLQPLLPPIPPKVSAAERRGGGVLTTGWLGEAENPSPTAGGNDDSDFRELHTAREFSEDDEEETTSQDWGTPRELTFSYIAFDGIVGSGGRRDSVARRPRPQGRSVSEPRDPPPQPGLGDSLESIPSLSQSPEPGRRGDPDTLPLAEHPLEDQLGWAARSAGSGEDSATSSSTPLENEEPDELEAIEPKEGEISEVLGGCVAHQDTSKKKAHGLSLSMTLEANLELRLAQALRSQLEVLTPQPSPSSRTPQAHTPSPSRSQDSNSGPDEPLLNEEEEHWRLLEQEPITAQCLDSTDQSEFILKPLLLGKWFVSRWLLWAVEDFVQLDRVREIDTFKCNGISLAQDLRTMEKGVSQNPLCPRVCGFGVLPHNAYANW